MWGAGEGSERPQADRQAPAGDLRLNWGFGVSSVLGMSRMGEGKWGRLNCPVAPLLQTEEGAPMKGLACLLRRKKSQVGWGSSRNLRLT